MALPSVRLGSKVVRTALRSSSGSVAAPATCERERTMTSFTEPHTPCILFDSPHSSSAFAAKRPTPQTTSPRSSCSELESQTHPVGAPSRKALARHRKPYWVGSASETASKPQRDTALDSIASAKLLPRARRSPDTIEAASEAHRQQPITSHAVRGILLERYPAHEREREAARSASPHAMYDECPPALSTQRSTMMMTTSA